MAIGKKGKKRQDQIINEAMSLIRQGGIKALTMRKVADIVGINEATAYRYFPDKTALLTAITEKIKAALMGPIKQLLESDLPPEVKLEKIVAVHLQFVHESNGLPLVFMAEVASGNVEVLVQQIRGIIQSYQEVLEGLVAEVIGADGGPSAQEFATLFFGMATAIAIQRRLGISTQAHKDLAGSMLPFIVKSMLDGNNHPERRE
ncbi:MAG TPA: TetR/AcrR family transcriptional regulator [candidate division Zixibacteria bacterium]|nr:TetR/AcrR family transcriptional regulator [candidate division Zixibacteria bacterium]